MKYNLSIAALVGSTYAALEAYAPPPTYGAETTSAPVAGQPTISLGVPQSIFPCNPAHQYPAGEVCTEIGGSLTLVTPTTAAPSSTGKPTISLGVPQSIFPCNPAHQYPGGAVCTEVSGSLTLVPATTAAASSTGYACNPAHQYPEGVVCSEVGGSLTLVTPTAVPTTTTEVVSSFTTYCPEATTFPVNGKTYTVTSATLLTITHCPGGCTLTKTQTPSISLGTPQSVYPTAVPTTTTEVVSSFTTYCPEATTFPVNGKTYTVTEPTTLTITHCPGGCTLTKTQTPSISLGTPQSVYPTAPASGKPTISLGTPQSAYPVSPVQTSIALGVPPSVTPSMATSTRPAYYPVANGTVPVGAAGTGTGSVPPTYTGAASKVAGSAVVGLIGMVAALL